MSFLFRSRSATTSPENSSHDVSAESLAKFHSLSGHVGNLTSQQQAALVQFRARLIEQHLYTPSSPAESKKASHSEATLLRFLRARKFDVNGAYKQFSESTEWRKKYNVDELYRTFPIDEMESSKRYYPNWTGRRDKRGLPIYVYRLADLDSTIQKEISSTPSERRYERIIALHEYMFQGIVNLCAALSKDAYKENPEAASQMRTREQLCSVTTIIDLSEASLTQMWAMRNHLQQASVLATANYPETIDSIFVVNSPSFFPTVWGWIQGWFDQGTRDKIKVLGNPTKDAKTFGALTTLIAKENIPRVYGGELDWSANQPPNLDEPARNWLKEVMGIEKIRGPIFVDPDAKDASSFAASSAAKELETEAASSSSDARQGAGAVQETTPSENVPTSPPTIDVSA